MEKIQDFFENNEPSSTRSEIIDHAVRVEYWVNKILATILGLGFKESKSFGNTSSALSFSHKINLLIDIQYMNEESKKKLICFSEIRNQFAHNFYVMEVSDCPKDYTNKLKSWYSNKQDSPDLKKCYIQLYADIISCIGDLFERLKLKSREKGKEIAQLEFLQSLTEQLKSHSLVDKKFGSIIKTMFEEANKKLDQLEPPKSFDGVAFL